MSGQRLLRLGIPLTAAVVVAASLSATTDAGLPLRPVELVASGLNRPVHAVPARGTIGRLYVVEQDGRIPIVDRSRILPRPFLDLRSIVGHGGLRGLLSLTFHPRYRANGLAYVNYVARDGAVIVAEIRTVRGLGRASSLRVLLRIPASKEAYAHFGGLLVFSPDGQLYVSIGDGGAPDAAQDPESMLGKIVRLHVGSGDPRPETVAWGLRNPWRFSFTPTGSALVIGDVGESTREEIHVVPRRLFGRANLGWPAFEGTTRRPRKPLPTTGVLLKPFLEYRHVAKRCYSVIGGFVYRGKRFPALRGRYVFGDLCGGFWSVRLTGAEAGKRRAEPFEAGGILTSIVEAADRELLLVSGDGRIVTPVGPT